MDKMPQGSEELPPRQMNLFSSPTASHVITLLSMALQIDTSEHFLGTCYSVLLLLTLNFYFQKSIFVTVKIKDLGSKTVKVN